MDLLLLFVLIVIVSIALAAISGVRKAAGREQAATHCPGAKPCCHTCHDH